MCDVFILHYDFFISANCFIGDILIDIIKFNVVKVFKHRNLSHLFSYTNDSFIDSLLKKRKRIFVDFQYFYISMSHKRVSIIESKFWIDKIKDISWIILVFIDKLRKIAKIYYDSLKIWIYPIDILFI